MIVINVLSPLSIEYNLQLLGDKRYSISIDASNKGNVKYYPLCVKFYDKFEGIKNFVLDFYEDSHEDSKSISDQTKSILLKNNLQIEKLVFSVQTTQM